MTDSDSKQARSLMEAARLVLYRERPYLARAIFAVEPVEEPRLPAPMAVDQRWRLYYRPDAVVPIAQERQLVGIYYHEICHLIRDHARRGRSMIEAGVPREAWATGAECEINDDVDREGRACPALAAPFSGPYGGILPEHYQLPRDETAEWYAYELLKQAAVIDVPLLGEGKGEGEHECDCGSGTDGVPRPWDRNGDGDGAGSSADHVPPGLSELEAELVRHAVAAEIRERQRSRGDVPAGLAVWAEDFGESVVSWQNEIASVVRVRLRRAGAHDYTYARPSRRQPRPARYIAPALRAPVVHAAVVVDVSGSMMGEPIKRAQAEIAGIVRAAGAEVVMIECDASVHRITMARSGRPDLLGGGGTDMSAGIRTALKLRPRPDLIIILTDGYTPWPSQRPPVPTVAAIIGEGAEGPDWAKCVHVPHE